MDVPTGAVSFVIATPLTPLDVGINSLKRTVRLGAVTPYLGRAHSSCLPLGRAAARGAAPGMRRVAFLRPVAKGAVAPTENPCTGNLQRSARRSTAIRAQ
jgi:hypothetical protein